VHVEKSGATRIVKNETELIAAIYRYYINPDVDQDNRKKLMQLQVSRPLAGTSKRIVDTLLIWQ
jgi:hypothetical protein